MKPIKILTLPVVMLITAVFLPLFPSKKKSKKNGPDAVKLAEYHRVLFWRDVRFVAWVAAVTVLILAIFVR